MATPTWSPSTFYATGALVQPATSQPAAPTPIPNASFESGNVEWTLDSGLSIVNGIEHFGPGTWSLQANTGFAGDRFAEMQDFVDCTPGENITARCQIQQGASSFGNTGGAVGLRFYDSLNALIQDFRGNEVIDGSGGAWHQSTVNASAPANTAFVRIYIYMKRVNQNLPFWADAVEWNKISQAQSGLIFRAVQPAVGLSGSVEPVWPLVNGDQVIDNEVIWEAVLATRITWEAHAILVSGAVEPTFPAQEGGTIGDNSISWRAVSRRITDPNCPNSKIVVIAASKVFAADDDIVAYSATVNPLDWSSADDAGYLPTNLQQYGANPVSGIGLYRGNLVPMNTQGSQVWQIDEDPAQMALLDAFPVGTAYHNSISPAFNDLFFAASLGVRTTGIAGGSTNLQSGDAGMPIDPLIQEALRNAQVNGDEINSLYYPAAGQYWLMFSPPSVPTGPLTLSGDFDDGLLTDNYIEGPLTVTNGFAPYRWELVSGLLPNGLELNPFTGILSGVPTLTGPFSFTVRVTDRFDRTDTQPCSVQINYSSGIVVTNITQTDFYSGENATFPLLQSIPAADDRKDLSGSGDAEFFGVCTSGSFFVYKRNELGAYILVSPTSSPAIGNSQGVCFTADGTYCFVVDISNIRQRLLKWDGSIYNEVQNMVGSINGVSRFSPDGEYLAVASAAPNTIQIYRRAGDVLTLLDHTDALCKGVAWQRDGRTLAYSFAVTGFGIRIVRVDGDDVTVLFAGGLTQPENAMIRWSIDGNFLYVGGGTGATALLQVYQWNGITLTLMPNPSVQPASTIQSMDLSIDGRILAVGTISATGGSVHLYEVNGATLTHITTGINGAIGDAFVTFFESSNFWSPP